jgi:hypothetical protein
VSSVSIESPTKSITKAQRDQRKFFIDKLSTIGSTLAVSAGFSVISMFEVVVFVYIVFMGIVLDVRDLWNKVVTYLRKAGSATKKKTAPSNNVAKVCYDNIKEGQQEIKKLYVST